MILLAIVLPPLTVLLCGKPFQALISIPLTACFWIPGEIHALMIVNARAADQRNKALINAINRRHN